MRTRKVRDTETSLKIAHDWPRHQGRDQNFYAGMGLAWIETKSKLLCNC